MNARRKRARRKRATSDVDWLTSAALQLLPPMKLPGDWENHSVAEIRDQLARVRERQLLLSYPENLSLLDVLAMEAVERARVLRDAVHGRLEGKVRHPTLDALNDRIEKCEPEEYDAAVRTLEIETFASDSEARKRLEGLYQSELIAGTPVPVSTILAKILKAQRPRTRWAYWCEYLREQELHRFEHYLAFERFVPIDRNQLPRYNQPWVLEAETLPFRVVFDDEATKRDKRDADAQPPSCRIIKAHKDFVVKPEYLVRVAWELEQFCLQKGMDELVARRQQAVGARRAVAARQENKKKKAEEKDRIDNPECVPDILAGQDEAKLNQAVKRAAARQRRPSKKSAKKR
ncbi:MAG: hypothetical protein ACKV19_05135 [Verrucomicrobiales bacterium]